MMRSRAPASRLSAPIALEHARQIVEYGERALLVDFLKYMHGVGSQNDPAARRIDPYDGLAARMAAKEQKLEAGGQG